MRDNESFEAVLEGGPAPRALNARDLVRGYRLDVWSDSSGQWRSLHRRDGSYQFGEHGVVTLNITDEEGFTQLAVMQPADDPTRPEDGTAAAAGVPQPSTDLYVNERIARWNGWSLSSPRPGVPLNRSADPAVAADPDPQADQPVTPFKMTTELPPIPARCRSCGSVIGTGCGCARWTWPAKASRRTRGRVTSSPRPRPGRRCPTCATSR